MPFARPLAAAAALAIALAGCGGGGSAPDDDGEAATADGPGATTPAVGAPPPATEPPGDSTATSDVPAIDVLDVHTGGTVDLASLVPADQPVLLWFWAPH